MWVKLLNNWFCYGVNKVWESVDNLWFLIFYWFFCFLLGGELNWFEKNVDFLTSII